MQKIQKRAPMSAADLFVLLDREFRRRQPRECGACYVQLPFRVDAAADGNANWEVVITRCPIACESVLQELVAEFQQRYELVTR
jgi:hypothetical protein